MKYRKRPVVVEAMQWEGDNGADLAAWTDGAFLPVEALHRKPDQAAPFCAAVALSVQRSIPHNKVRGD